MSKYFMAFQLFLVFLFFIDAEVKANPMERCVEMVKFDDKFDEIIHMAGEEQLSLFCRNMTNFMECTNDVVKQETGFNLRELADLLKGTEIGKSLTLILNVADLIDEVCTEGTELRSGLLAHADCFQDVDSDLPKECENKAKDAYRVFRELYPTRSGRKQQMDEPCVIAAYQLGCLGAAVHEECGDEAFETYKDVVKKIGFFKVGVCSSELVNTIKTSVIDSLDLSESRKALYRVILELRKRRK